ncbi:MAG TPA: DUF6600 domain-containing protein [Gemmatimonadaceae bacterium]|nr:DUF6600 domain-containing protein [Gemmatimonadaceae bacterium]
MIRSVVRAVVVSAIAAAGMAHGMAAQGVPMPPSESNPPGRAARLAVVQGAVSFRPAAGDTWALADQNRALTTGDRLWVDSVGRTELQIGADAVRASSETELDIVRLDDHDMQFRLPQGSTFVHLTHFDTAQNYELDAPNAAITFEADGEYRVDVTPDGQTTKVTAWSGQASVTAGGQSFNVTNRQAATITGDSTATYNVADAGGPDNFDSWAEARDQQYARPSRSAQYVSQDMGGTADLDDNGRWEEDPEDGPVWYPTAVAGDWAPYHEGHWVWEGPWGWTWVDDESWGWAPFHYGRWAYFHDRWGWCPGPRVYEPVFAPALVAFVGGGGWGVSVGIGGPAVGWFPLGPREPYYPAYRTDVRYRERVNVYNYTNIRQVTNVNVTNVTNVTYVNRNVTNAVTVVPTRSFANGDGVARASVRVSPAQLGRAPIAGHTAPVVPTSRSLAPRGVAVGGGRDIAPPSRLATRAVVATHAPPPAAVPFAAQQRALTSNGGRPLAPTQLASARAAVPAARVNSFPVRPATLATPSGRGLTPARPGVPAPHPVTAVGFAARPTPRVATPVATPAERVQTNGRASVPTPAGQPNVTASRPNVPTSAARSNVPAPPAARSNVPAPAQHPTVSTPAQRVPAQRVPAPTLTQDYQQQRAQMETRHQQEFAAPAPREQPAQLQQRQEAEHQSIDRTYQQAASSGAQHMPAPAPRPAAPAPRAPSPQPQPQQHGGGNRRP